MLILISLLENKIKTVRLENLKKLLCVCVCVCVCVWVATLRLVSYLYTPGGVCGMRKLFSRSRSTSFSIRTWDGSRSLGSFAGLIVSDWKNAAWSLREEAEDSMA